MKKFVVLAALAASGCALSADIDKYTSPLPGGDLIGSIPGYPSGDQIAAPTFGVLPLDRPEIGGQAFVLEGEINFRTSNHTRPTRCRFRTAHRCCWRPPYECRSQHHGHHWEG